MTIPGDPFGTIKDDKKVAENVTPPKSVNEFHTKSDVDSTQFAQHHTLGLKHNQAAAGDHTHNGKDSRLIGKGSALSVTGSKGGNVALANLLAMLKSVIDFTDTTT